MSAGCCFLYLFACTSNRDEQGCLVLSAGGSQGWGMRFFDLGILPLAYICVCLFTPLTGACVQEVCVSHIHTCTWPSPGFWGRKHWAVLSGCLPWQSVHGTKAAQGSHSPLVPLAQPPLCLGRGEWALMASSTVMPRAGEPGQGALMLQQMSSYLAVPLAVSMGTRSPGLCFPWGCSPDGCAPSLTFTLPLLFLSPAPWCRAATSSPAFKPSQQLSLSPISECIQAVPRCLLPIPAPCPSVPA